MPRKSSDPSDVFLPLDAERHHVQVHAVELDVRIEHREAGRRKVNGGELHVVAVEGLLDHNLVQQRGVPSPCAIVQALGFGGDRHQQRAGAAGEVGDVERARVLVVAPVDAGGPAVEDEPGKHVAAGTDV